MLNVLGAGCAYPANVIDNDFLAGLGLAASPEEAFEQTGIEKRRSALPLEYLRETGNADPGEAVRRSLCSPSTLALEACREALAHAGVKMEQVGLVLGEAVNPRQLVPAEAQRVAGMMGLKVPAFDVRSGGGGLPFYLDRLARWRAEDAPEFVLCFSTGTLTECVDYRGLAAGLYFGDGAGAAVLAWRHPGRFSLEKSCALCRIDREPELIVPSNGHLQAACSGWKHRSAQRMAAVLDELELGEGAQGKNLMTVFSGCGSGAAVGLPRREGGSLPWQPQAGDNGELLGAGSFCALSRVWQAAPAGGELVLVSAGLGPISGGVRLSIC